MEPWTMAVLYAVLASTPSPTNPPKQIELVQKETMQEACASGWPVYKTTVITLPFDIEACNGTRQQCHDRRWVPYGVFKLQKCFANGVYTRDFDDPGLL